jgi:hypothetical protein
LSNGFGPEQFIGEFSDRILDRKVGHVPAGHVAQSGCCSILTLLGERAQFVDSNPGGKNDCVGWDNPVSSWCPVFARAELCDSVRKKCNRSPSSGIAGEDSPS